MASYTVAPGHTITHDQQVYGPGEQIELTDDQAMRLTGVLTDGPKVPAVPKGLKLDDLSPEQVQQLKDALDSILRRPDNPDRPPSVEGEERTKVNHKGPLGDGKPGPSAPPANADEAKAIAGGKGKTEK